ncbi:NeuD/PglB/VioB family sugar acetyltransferase [Candidatus Pelagibacter bacterium]|jgi:sugar O-acyltransferase (sialic acid O-acetyltransferase NeuD family)|nr:NeuD/PglB/VioB family sugar acetyltransferase [Candidatus Pelagibacter bacterium]
MLKKLLIIGSGGHFKVAINEILKQKKYKIQEIIDIKNFGKKLNINNKLKKIINYKKFNWSKVNQDTFLFIAIGDNYLRKKIVSEIKKENIKIKWGTVISRDAIIGKNVKIKPGSLVVSGSIINPGTIIGSHCVINTRSSIDHDNIFGDFSSSAPSVVTGGNVTVGELSFLGIRSTIINNIKIGSKTIIGANSLVNKNCLSNYTYYGSPAKKIKKNII